MIIPPIIAFKGARLVRSANPMKIPDSNNATIRSEMGNVVSPKITDSISPIKIKAATIKRTVRARLTSSATDYSFSSST